MAKKKAVVKKVVTKTIREYWKNRHRISEEERHETIAQLRGVAKERDSWRASYEQEKVDRLKDNKAWHDMHEKLKERNEILDTSYKQMDRQLTKVIQQSPDVKLQKEIGTTRGQLETTREAHRVTQGKLHDLEQAMKEQETEYKEYIAELTNDAKKQAITKIVEVTAEYTKQRSNLEKNLNRVLGENLEYIKRVKELENKVATLYDEKIALAKENALKSLAINNLQKQYDLKVNEQEHLQAQIELLKDNPMKVVQPGELVVGDYMSKQQTPIYQAGVFEYATRDGRKVIINQAEYSSIRGYTKAYGFIVHRGIASPKCVWDGHSGQREGCYPSPDDLVGVWKEPKPQSKPALVKGFTIGRRVEWTNNQGGCEIGNVLLRQGQIERMNLIGGDSYTLVQRYYDKSICWVANADLRDRPSHEVLEAAK